MAVYLDCAATAPVDPRVQREVMTYLGVEFGNAGSRHHGFGARARSAVEKARVQVAALVAATRGEIIFTSGATESNNLALLGLAEYGAKTGRTHLVSTRIEHKSVLEPLQALSGRGFEITLVPPEPGGWVHPHSILEAVREDTLLVSVMQVNNETGVMQPLRDIARLLENHPAYLHVDAAQGFGKEIAPLRDRRIDLISISGHKVYAPKGIGALVTRRRGGRRPPLTPLMHGGGQELGLRPGTLPVPLIAGLGKASELALAEHRERNAACRKFKEILLAELQPLKPVVQRRSRPDSAPDRQLDLARNRLGGSHRGGEPGGRHLQRIRLHLDLRELQPRAERSRAGRGSHGGGPSPLLVPSQPAARLERVHSRN